MEQVFHMEHGRLVCRTQGKQVEVTMTARPQGPGLYRGILLGRSGRVDLGTLLPEGEELGLHRTLSVEYLKKCGCWPVMGGRAELRYAFGQRNLPRGWRQREDLAALFADPILARRVEEAPGALWQPGEGEGFSLSFPWDPKAPFPLVPVFCFARVENLSGRPWVVLSFRDGSWPMVPPSCQNPESGVK